MANKSLNVNGKRVSITYDDPQMPLLYVLRDNLGLRGPRFGCGLGQCGACTVHIDGAAVRSCITPLTTVNEKQCACDRSPTRRPRSRPRCRPPEPIRGALPGRSFFLSQSCRSRFRHRTCLRRLRASQGGRDGRTCSDRKTACGDRSRAGALRALRDQG